jgi:hypothetical protein
MTASTRIRPARQVSNGDQGRRRRATEPVFLDRTGRRRRIVVAAAAAATVLLSLIMLALLAGFTGAGPGVMPGWPAADGHAQPARPSPDRTEPSPSAAIKARAPVRSSAPTPTALPTSAAPTVTAPPTTASAVPTASATTRGNGRGRNPSHTPNPHSSKKP